MSQEFDQNPGFNPQNQPPVSPPNPEDQPTQIQPGVSLPDNVQPPVGNPNPVADNPNIPPGNPQTQNPNPGVPVQPDHLAYQPLFDSHGHPLIDPASGQQIYQDLNSAQQFLGPLVTSAAGQTPEDKSKIKLPKAALIVYLLLAFVLGGALLGYLAYSQGQSSGKEDGYQAGLSAGITQTNKNYQKGSSGYNTIYQQGYQAGLSKGKAQAESQAQDEGEKQGYAQGQKDTQADILGDYSWTDDQLYIITMKAGDPKDNQPSWMINSQQAMEQGQAYEICKDDPRKACVVVDSPNPSSGSSSQPPSNSSGSNSEPDRSASPDVQP